MMGHSTVQETERCVPLRPGLFTEADLRTMKIDLKPPRSLPAATTRRSTDAAQIDSGKRSADAA